MQKQAPKTIIKYSTAINKFDKKLVAALAAGAAAIAITGAYFLFSSKQPTQPSQPSQPQQPEKDLADYAKEQGLPDEFANLYKGVKLTDDGKQHVKIVKSSLELYGGNKNFVEALKNTVKDHVSDKTISSGEVEKVNNIDGDPFPQVSEEYLTEGDVGGNPVRYDEILEKALDNGLRPEEKAWSVVVEVNEATCGKVTPEAEKVIQAVASTPQDVRNDQRYVEAVDNALKQGLEKAAEIAGDVDLDGLTNAKEVKELHTDPFTPNPVIAYAVQKGLDVSLLDLLFSLEKDGRLDVNDKRLVDILERYQENLLKEVRFRSKVLKRNEIGGWYTPEEEVVATPLTLVKYVVEDGAVDERELTAVEIVGEKPVVYMGLSGRLAVGWQPFPGGGKEILLKFTPEELGVLIDFLASHPDFARANPYATYGLVKGGSMLLYQLGNGMGIPTIMKPLEGGMDYAKVYTWNGVEVSVKKVVDAHVANLEGCPEVLERLKADYVLENAGDPLTADLRVVTAAFPPYLLHIADFEKRMYFYEVLPRDVAYDALPRLWLAWKNVSYWPELHRIAERVLAGKEIDPDTGKPYTSVDSLKLRFKDFGPKTRADMLKLATEGSEMARAAFPLYHYAIYNHDSIDEFRVELYRALMWAEGWPSYRAGNIDAKGHGHGRPGIPLAPSDIAMFDEYLVIEPLTRINPYHPFRSDENYWNPTPSEYKGDWTIKSIIQYPWYEKIVFKEYEVPSNLKD